MKWVVLWTDACVFLLVLSLVLFMFLMLNNQHNRERWLSVFRSKLGMISFIVILSYVFIALMDSIHFRMAFSNADIESETQETFYSNEIISVLDLFKGEPESTYSKPFAIEAYNRIMAKDEEGNTVRVHPRLQHAGVHLDEGQSQWSDIVSKSLVGVVYGLLISALVIGAHRVILLIFLRGSIQESSSSQVGNGSPIAWKTAYITLMIIISVFTWMMYLSQYYHILGTDQVGRDTLFSCLKGIRTGVLIGALSTLIMMPIAITLGIVAGYFKGWVDDVVQYLYTTLSSIPSILLIAASVLMFKTYIDNHPDVFEVGMERADAKFIAICCILGVTSWATLCRLMRAETLRISQLDYVQAAHAFGVSHVRILMRHILPNVKHIILITFVMDFSAIILMEAVLSYIGVGVESPMVSWGGMINLARAELAREPVVWWNLVGAFIFMFILVLASNLFSDLVNEAFDPKNNRRISS